MPSLRDVFARYDTPKKASIEENTDNLPLVKRLDRSAAFARQGRIYYPNPHDDDAYLDEVAQHEAPDVSPASPLFRRGTQEYLAGQYDQAEQTFKKAIKLDPKRADEFNRAIQTIQQEKEAVKKYAVAQ